MSWRCCCLTNLTKLYIYGRTTREFRQRYDNRVLAFACEAFFRDLFSFLCSCKLCQEGTAYTSVPLKKNKKKPGTSTHCYIRYKNNNKTMNMLVALLIHGSAAAAAQLKTNGRLTTVDVTLVLRKSLLRNERVALEHFEQFNQETMASPGLFNCYKEKDRQKRK